MTKLLEEAHRMEQIPGVEAVTVAAGFPWSDIKEAGMSFIVITNNDQRLADSLAQELSDLAWTIRRDFLVKPMPVREALRKVKAAKEGPIVLADIGDNPGGGTPCDGTFVLKAVLEEGLTGGVFGVIWDPAAAAKAAKAGPGKEIEVSLGGHTDRLHGKPIKSQGAREERERRQVDREGADGDRLTHRDGPHCRPQRLWQRHDSHLAKAPAPRPRTLPKPGDRADRRPSS